MKALLIAAGVAVGYGLGVARFNRREAFIRDREWADGHDAGFDDGHLAGWIEHQQHVEQAEHTARVARRADHPSRPRIADPFDPSQVV